MNALLLISIVLTKRYAGIAELILMNLLNMLLYKSIIHNTGPSLCILQFFSSFKLLWKSYDILMGLSLRSFWVGLTAAVKITAMIFPSLLPSPNSRFSPGSHSFLHFWRKDGDHKPRKCGDLFSFAAFSGIKEQP